MTVEGAPFEEPSLPTDQPVLVPLGWDDRVAALYAEIDEPDRTPGRVLRVERGACAVATPSGERLALAPDLPAVGDWVAVRDADGDAAVVVDVAPRWSELSRRDPDGTRVQVLAANLDLVVVTAPADRLSANRVDREVVLAWESGAVPLVVLTKADLAADGAVADLGRRLGAVEVLATSTVTTEGLDVLAERLRPARTAVLLGPSGAGKSSLTNALLGSDLLAIGDVRDADQRGRHTTTGRSLHVVPGGGVLIDTPGLRSLGLIGDGEGIAAAFPEVDALAATCRFADCAHDSEPGCAVLAAEARGELDPERLASYRKLLRELAFEARKADPLVRKEAARKWKIVNQEARKRSRR